VFADLFRRGGRGHRRAGIALVGDGTHSVSLDEVSLGGLAVNVVE
jgi:hypothetical protein